MSEANTTPAPGEQGGPLTDFDKEFQTFMSHDFGSPELQDEDAGSETESASGGETETSAASSGQDSISGADGADNVGSESAPSNDATTSGENGQDSIQGANADDAVDPALLAAMHGLASPEPKKEPAPSVAPDKDKTAPTTSSDEEEDFMPFEPNFRLSPQVVSALFEAEDMETREKALVGLLSSYGNAVAATVVAHVQKTVLPGALTKFSESVVQDQTRNAVTTSFYSAFPELEGYKPAVQRAFAIIAEKEPNLQWGEATAKRIARLVEATLKQSGIPITVKGLQTPATSAKTPLPPVDPKKAPGSGFEAGGSRLSSDTLGSADGPAKLVEELTNFW